MARERKPDYWTTRGAGSFADTRRRWPPEVRAGAESRHARNWPEVRSGGRAANYGYFGHSRYRPELVRSARGQGSGSANLGRYTGWGPRNYTRSDERIREDVYEAIADDPVCDASGIDIAVKEGEVTLSGNVPARHMKHRAEDIADATRGVHEVENRIRVKRAEAPAA